MTNPAKKHSQISKPVSLTERRGSDDHTTINDNPKSPLNDLNEGALNNEALAQKNSTKRKRDNNDENDASSASKSPAKKRAKASSPKKSKSSESKDLFTVHLDGEEDDSVPIFDSCDIIREKIHKHLSETGTTKAQFLRDIARAAYPAETPTPKIQSKQLNDFLGYEGATAGNSSRVFYAAYVYFEKKRIHEGKPKSGHRLAMERQWGEQGGLSRRHSNYIRCRVDEVPWEDGLGVIKRFKCSV